MKPDPRLVPAFDWRAAPPPWDKLGPELAAAVRQAAERAAAAMPGLNPIKRPERVVAIPHAGSVS